MNSALIEARLQVPSRDWLKVFGLSGQNLTLDQILPSLGFQQHTGHVASLQKNVSSQYADGIFIQHQDSFGNIYNLCGANATSIKTIENDLQTVLSRLKARSEWLNTGSRLSFGVVYGRKVVVLMDTCATEHAQLKTYLDVLVSVIKDQLVNVDEFNLIRCTAGAETWRNSLTETSKDNISSAIEWVGETTPQTTPFKTNVVEGLAKALAHSNAESVYLFAHGEGTLRAFDLLLEKVNPSLVPVHVVVYDCKSPQALEQYKQLATASGARCHAYCPPPPPPPPPSRNPLLSSFSSLSSAGNRSPPPKRPESGRSISSVNNSRPQSALSINSVLLGPIPTLLPNVDLDSVRAEIEVVRDTLAEIQALYLEVGVAHPTSIPTEQELDEESLTSQQWLKMYGTKAKKLRYEDLVDSLAFQHCNGIVQIPVPKYHRNKNGTETIEVIPQSRVVHAQYCKDFVHVRYNSEKVALTQLTDRDYKTVHVQLTDKGYKTYQSKVKNTITKCQKRLVWLKEGSRELFGTLLESKVVVVIDTSSSVKGRLDLIKNKVRQLLQEQLSHKKEFTLIHFNSSVHPWRSSLVPTSSQNLDAVGQWVGGLLAEGSTDTLGALEVAMSISEAEGVYLLTDGRPDQPIDLILARVQQLPHIPVHTISFNCADSKANHFLSELSSNTGGRYYYFSEDTADPEGPTAYQSDDIQKLVEEIDYAQEQLQLGAHLLAECKVVRKRGNRRGRGTPGGRGKGPPGSAGGRGTSDGNKKGIKSSGKNGGGIRKYKLSSKKWLEKNSLSSLHLTIMDALGPASIPHTSKHVPLLGKDVTSKVFATIFPLAHISNGNEVTLINPNGVNLKDYEEKLANQVDVYWDRLSHIAWLCLEEEVRSSLADSCKEEEEAEGEREGAEIPSYKDHRDKIWKVLEESGWPRPKEDFDLLEREIDLADNFKKYVKALKIEARKATHKNKKKTSPQKKSVSSISNSRSANEEESDVVGMYSPLSSGSSIQCPEEPHHAYSSSFTSSSHTLSPNSSSQPPHTHSPSSSSYSSFSSSLNNGAVAYRKHLKGQKVIVLSKEDGFYYPGLVVHEQSRKAIKVKLMDQQKVTAPLTHIIQVGGARPCPMLNIGDHVLVRVRTQHGPHPSSSDGSCDYFIPGITHVLPSDNRKGHALYTMVVFNGRCVTASRRGIVRISQAQYEGSCNYIKTVKHSPPARSGGSEVRSEVRSAGTELSKTIISIPQVDSSSLCGDYEDEGTRTKSKTPPHHQGPSRSQEHQSASSSRRAALEEGRGKEGKDQEFFSKEDIMKWVVEQQRMHKEALEEQKKEMSSMQVRQDQLEEGLIANKKMGESQVRRSPLPPPPPFSLPDGAPSSPPPPLEPVRPVMVEVSTTTDCPLPLNWITGYLSDKPHPQTLLAGTTEQAMNTEVWTEDRGMGTDPMTESRGVGTEWNESETESEFDSANSPDGGVSTDITANVGGSHDQHLINSPLSSHTPLSNTPISSLTPSPPASSHSHSPSHTPPVSGYSHSPSHTPIITPPHHSTPLCSPPPITTPTTSPHTLLPPNEEGDPLINQHVLARWPDDGWYYRGVVVSTATGEMWYQVEDASHDKERIHASDIIIDEQDALASLQVGDMVAALHPAYTFSYAPGKLTGIASDGSHFSVELYDGAENFLHRRDIYRLAPGKYIKDVEYLRMKEKAWVGQAVVARRERDGLYLPGEVVEQRDSRQYVIRWAGAGSGAGGGSGAGAGGAGAGGADSGSSQVQEVVHMYGLLTKRRGLHLEDHVLALADKKSGLCLPGVIREKVGYELRIQFCDGQSSLVDPTKCFWLIPEYYQKAVEFIAANVSPSSSQASLSTLEASSTTGKPHPTTSGAGRSISEYSASYI